MRPSFWCLSLIYLFFIIVPAVYPKMVTGRNSSSTGVKLNWQSVQEKDGEANGKVGYVFLVKAPSKCVSNISLIVN